MKPSFEQLKEVTQGYYPICVALSSNNSSNTRSLMAYYYNTSLNGGTYVWKYVTLTDNGKFVARIPNYQAQSSYNEIRSLSCLTEEDLIIKPELQVYWVLASIAILALIFSVIYKIIIKRLLP